eukprot:1710956-Prorocentrum_lima.AAC.1
MCIRDSPPLSPPPSPSQAAGEPYASCELALPPAAVSKPANKIQSGFTACKQMKELSKKT